MDLLLDLIVTLSRWSRSHLNDISLAIIATTLVLVGPSINAWVQRHTSSMNFILRTFVFVLLCAIGYGLLIVGAAPYLAQALGYFNNFTLAPVLILVFFIIGIMADHS